MNIKNQQGFLLFGLIIALLIIGLGAYLYLDIDSDPESKSPILTPTKADQILDKTENVAESLNKDFSEY